VAPMPATAVRPEKLIVTSGVSPAIPRAR
jgi:hypothetical protein